MTRLTDELKALAAEDSPHRLAYYERTLNRIASEVGGNAKFHAERTASIVDEIDGLRKEFKALVERVDRMAEFLTALKKERNGDKKHNDPKSNSAA